MERKELADLLQRVGKAFMEFEFALDAAKRAAIKAQNELYLIGKQQCDEFLSSKDILNDRFGKVPREVPKDKP